MRYYFDLIDGTSLPDLVGAELSDDVMAFKEARARADYHRKVQKRADGAYYRYIRVKDAADRRVVDVAID